MPYICKCKDESATDYKDSMCLNLDLDGGRHTWSLKLTIDLEKRGSRWLMKLIKAGTY